MIGALAQFDVGGWASHFAIVLSRTIGLFIFLPIFGSNILPIRLRVGIALMFAVVFLPFAPQIDPAPAGIAAWGIVTARELAAGLGLGVAARVLFAGIEYASQLVSGQSGFSLSSMIDPSSGDQSAAPNLFINLLAIALFLAADLHHLFILALEKSYSLLPPAIALPNVSGLDQIVGVLGMRLFTLAVELAAPALIVSITVDLVMVLVGKAMPQVPILVVGYPLKMAIGLMTMALLAYGTGSAIGWVGRTLSSDGATILQAFAKS